MIFFHLRIIPDIILHMAAIGLTMATIGLTMSVRDKEPPTFLNLYVTLHDIHGSIYVTLHDMVTFLNLYVTLHDIHGSI